MFGFRGKQGTQFYLENFVEGDTADTKFSSITDDIHDTRNVMAHQGYSSLQHRVEYFADEIPEGWKQDGDSILINPKLYADRFEGGFRHGTIIDKYQQVTNEIRTIRKYQYINQWLRLDSKPNFHRDQKTRRLCDHTGCASAGSGCPKNDLCGVRSYMISLRRHRTNRWNASGGSVFRIITGPASLE